MSGMRPSRPPGRWRLTADARARTRPASGGRCDRTAPGAEPAGAHGTAAHVVPVGLGARDRRPLVAPAPSPAASRGPPPGEQLSRAGRDRATDPGQADGAARCPPARAGRRHRERSGGTVSSATACAWLRLHGPCRAPPHTRVSTVESDVVSGRVKRPGCVKTPDVRRAAQGPRNLHATCSP